MYIVKLCKRSDKEQNTLVCLAVYHYQYFENALASIGNREIFESLSEEEKEGLGELHFHNFSKTVDGIADDFAFYYANDIVITLSKVVFEDV